MFTDDRLARMEQEGVLAWLMHGRDDPVVPMEDSTTLAERFEANGIPVALHLIAAEHSTNDEALKIGQQWLEEVVRGE